MRRKIKNEIERIYIFLLIVLSSVCICFSFNYHESYSFITARYLFVRGASLYYICMRARGVRHSVKIKYMMLCGDTAQPTPLFCAGAAAQSIYLG